MKFKVTRYDELQQIWLATDETGKQRRIDFMVDGTLDRRYKKPESLVGKTLSSDYITAYQEIAHEVKIVNEDSEYEKAFDNKFEDSLQALSKL